MDFAQILRNRSERSEPPRKYTADLFAVVGNFTEKHHMLPTINDEKLPIPDVETGNIYHLQQEFFKTGVTRSFTFRKGQLGVLKKAVKRYENDIFAALEKDLGKSAFESYATEVGLFYEEIEYMLRHLAEWMKPRRVQTPLTLFPSSATIYPQPLGCVLIISPWNYPFNLVMMPLAAAIAAGNTVIIKPSELAPESEKIITTIISETFEPEYIAVIHAEGPMVSQVIASHHFDHIFFTGSTAVGSKIMEAAAKQLSPVTLELGGKSPCIVAKDAALDFAAKKIAWSKWTNAGQTCVAPDYLLVHQSVKDALLAKIAEVTTRMFGEDASKSPDYGRIINKKRWEIVAGYLGEGDIYYGGKTDAGDRYISPTILTGVDAGSRLMQEEIFGPVLPVISYREKEEVLAWVEKNPYPLACYVYTENRKTAQFYIDNIRFGGGAINNGLVHLGNPNLPFGGVGYSGMGAYHGRSGFDVFTHYKSIQKTQKWFDLPMIYPPYKGNLKWLKRVMK